MEAEALDYVAKPDKLIDAAQIAKDDHCELGRWIHAEADKRASDSAFSELRREHAGFHRAAADVVRRANSGQAVSEEVMLGAHSAFSRSTAAVVHALTMMKEHAEKAHH